MPATKPSRQSRIATLKERVEAAEQEKRPTFDVPFRGKYEPLRKVRIDIDFPLYRIQSGRTHRAQCQYLEEHPDLPKDFFADPEDPKVQKAQHEILLRLIREKDLDKDLGQRGQLAPLVLTYDGYVVDGNRRLAALREKRSDFAEAAVLPSDAENAEIFDTEIELQMQRETKAPYNWVDQAIHIEYGIRELKERLNSVARRMRLPEERIRRDLEKLNLVKQYLVWLGAEGQYHKVPTSGVGQMEQAFEEVATRFSNPAIKRKNRRKGA